jgi:NCS1 family nucleobase:cation symporter-1
VAGVLIAGYWIRSGGRLDLPSLYRASGRYWFSGGWNWRAVIATVAGATLSVGGAYTAAGTAGPFPASGLIPVLRPLYDYSWVVGLGVGLALYLILSLPLFGAVPDGPRPATAPVS